MQKKRCGTFLQLCVYAVFIFEINFLVCTSSFSFLLSFVIYLGITHNLWNCCPLHAKLSVYLFIFISIYPVTIIYNGFFLPRSCVIRCNDVAYSTHRKNVCSKGGSWTKKVRYDPLFLAGNITSHSPFIFYIKTGRDLFIEWYTIFLFQLHFLIVLFLVIF